MNHKKIFEFIKDIVFNQGGDGDCIIICQDFRKLAHEFYEYETNLDNAYYVWGNEGKDWVTFSGAEEWEESIVFTSSTKEMDRKELHDVIIYFNDYI